VGLTKRRDSWYVEFHVLDDGKHLSLARGVAGAKLKRWKVSSTNRTIAKQQEALIKTELMKGLIKSEHLQGPVLFKHLTEAYLAAPEIQRQALYDWKVRMVRGRLLPIFGDKIINTITAGMIEEYRAKRRTEPERHGTPVKIATINRDLALLKHLFSYAIREGWLERNPVSLVKFDKENNARDRVLSPNEFELLQRHSSPHLQAINLMAYQTGMRRGEILNLTWDRVDLKAGLIRLKAEDTKTDEARFVPLTADLTAKLKELYKVRYLHEPHVFLVNGKSVSSIKTAFNAACRRAKIEGFRFHDFRHTAVTNMRRAGIDHLTIMRITGHKTLEVFKRYNSFLENDLREAAHRFNTYITLAHQDQNGDTHKSAISQLRRP
jgi:integrase